MKTATIFLSAALGLSLAFSGSLHAALSHAAALAGFTQSGTNLNFTYAFTQNDTIEDVLVVPAGTEILVTDYWLPFSSQGFWETIDTFANPGIGIAVVRANGLVEPLPNLNFLGRTTEYSFTTGVILQAGDRIQAIASPGGLGNVAGIKICFAGRKI